MGSFSYVLQALRILRLPEIQRLSEILHSQKAKLKKAAGAEFIIWEDDSNLLVKKEQSPDAEVIPFPKKKVLENEQKGQDDVPKESPTSEGTEPQLIATSDVLWQRELMKKIEPQRQKKVAILGYKQSTEMYVVRSTTESGKEKIRFASTDGILINKKQA